ncbi:hypothetical protein FISHEDRAFT_35407 [Fistulina hepatica ATCC 64428]|uniref:Abscisic acid G-protein coupled receptor-like domain-containing protein n=1 Tax=Fistulina hepatica ATCC 64428 TaxID=1128425 RepID=A0A0D7ALU4_9AGAR|nr:hypothetical protein FISHEDRAFT_35407 [Fistulina hepatica ATCC 64428]
MFLLLLCQALNIFTPSARQLHWTFAILILLFLIIVLIPFIMSFVTIMGHGRRFDSVRTCFVLVLMALYLLGFSYIPVPAGVNSTDIVGLSFARLVVLGTTILGILSGFGAVSNAWDHLPWLSRQRSAPSHAQVQAVRERLTTTQVDIAMLSEQIQNQDSTTTSRQWSFNSIVSQLRGGDERAQVLRGLQALEVQMSRQLEDLEQRLTKAERERTFHGRMLNLTGFVFAAYCCLRVLSSIIHICSASTSSRTTSDLLTDLIAYAVSVLTPSATLSMDDVAIISHQISLVLVGVIILSSLRQVLRGVTRVLKVTSRNLGASLMLMVVAQLMGIYLLATIVQLRTSFPPDPVENNLFSTIPEYEGIYLLATIVQLRTSFPPDPVENNLFSTIPEYEVFGALFDWAFLITAVVSGCTRWVTEWATTDATD